jgi:hypothetical protein
MPGGLLHVFELNAVFERGGGERVIMLRSVAEPPSVGG